MVTGQDRFEELPEDVMTHVNLACNRFEQRWQAGERPSIEALLDDLGAEYRDAVVRELLPLEIEYRRRAGLDVSLQWYQTRFGRCRVGGVARGHPLGGNWCGRG